MIGNQVRSDASPFQPPRYSALLVLLLFGVYTTVFYWRALSSGVISDGWVLLEIGSRGFAKAPFAQLAYHVIPVAHLFTAGLWKLFGLDESWYQLLNLAELTVVGWLVFLLGGRLFAEPRTGLLAGVLFLSNASFYDVPLWPVVGNIHSLAAIFGLAGLCAVLQAFRSRRPFLWAAAFGLLSLAAFFTYEPAASVLAAGLLYAFFVPVGATGPAKWKEGLSRVLVLLPAGLAAVGIILASKLWAASQGLTVLLLPSDFQGLEMRLFLFVRGVISLFTFRGDEQALHALFSFGLSAQLGSRAFHALLGGWLLGLAAIAGILLARVRAPVLRFLVLWLAGHLLLVSAAVGMVSRHLYLAAVPASLIAAWALWWLAGRWATACARYSTCAQGGSLGILVGVSLVVASARMDIVSAADLHREVTLATRQVTDLVRRRLSTSPVPQEVIMVNMPALQSRGGLGAFAFGNGLTQQLHLTTRGKLLGARYFHTYDGNPAGKYADTSRPIALSELTRLVRDPGVQVLAFDRRTRAVVELDPMVWRVPDRYTPETAPYFEWQGGSWPWMRVHARQALELPLTVGRERSWVGLRYLRRPGTAVSVSAGPRILVQTAFPEQAATAWASASFSVLADQGAEILTISSESELWLAGVWSFAPPSAYTPEVAPFLSWNLRPFPAFAVVEPLALPFETARCVDQECTLRIEYLAERGRDFDLAVGDGPRRRVGFGDLTAPEWRTERIATEPSEELVVRVEPRGNAPLVVRNLAWEAAVIGLGTLQSAKP